MKKISMKNMLKHATLYIAVAFFVPLFSMDGTDVALLPGSGQIILFLLEKRLDLFDHHTLCSLAINKRWDKLLLDTAPARKKGLIAQAKNLLKCNFNEHDKIAIWHKYGGGWGKKIDGGVYDNGYLREYTMQVQYLGCKEIYSWFSYENIDFGSPRFDERGNFVYYFLTLKGDPHEVRESGYSRNIPCRLLLEKDDYCERFMEMGFLTAFPHLLHKFLRDLTMHKSGQFKFCDLQKIIIPDNYKECKPNKECTSWRELDEDLRELIDKRYRDQKK